MTKEEYNSELEIIELLYKEQKRTLTLKFVRANNTVIKGDIVTDNFGSIKVESFGLDVGYINDYPSMTYYGLELKKDLTPKKNGKKRNVFQRSVIKTNLKYISMEKEINIKELLIAFSRFIETDGANLKSHTAKVEAFLNDKKLSK